MDIKCKCGSTTFFTEQHGDHIGLYCSECGSWKKWLSKDETRLYSHDSINLYDRLMKRINESAVEVSTTKLPHTYMKAVGTNEIDRILRKELKRYGK